MANIADIAIDIDAKPFVITAAIAALDAVYQEACNDCSQYFNDSPEQLALSKFADKIDKAIAELTRQLRS